MQSMYDIKWQLIVISLQVLLFSKGYNISGNKPGGEFPNFVLLLVQGKNRYLNNSAGPFQSVKFEAP